MYTDGEYKCDDCGEVVEPDELYDTVDGEFCLVCYFGQMEAIKKIPAKGDEKVESNAGESVGC